MDEYTVLDHFYTEEEGKDVFSGTYDECENYINKESSNSTMFEIILTSNL